MKKDIVCLLLKHFYENICSNTHSCSKLGHCAEIQNDALIYRKGLKVLPLRQRRRRWPNIKPTLHQPILITWWLYTNLVQRVQQHI